MKELSPRKVFVLCLCVLFAITTQGQYTFNNQTALPGLPSGKGWKVVDELTDDFNANSLNTGKWDDYHPHWSGRAPSAFKKGNAFQKDGFLQLRSTLLKDPSQVGDKFKDIWVNAAACVSKGKTAKPGYYYEARIKASSLSMTSSFWFRVGSFSEIDVIEHIGNPSRPNRQDDLPFMYSANTHYYGKHQGLQNKKAEYRMPTRGRDKFHNFGFWWKSPTELLFYLDGKQIMRLVPRVPLDENLKMIFDTEVFPFASAGVANIGLPLPKNLNDNSKNTMLVDWIRVYQIGNGTTTPPSPPIPTPTPTNSKPVVNFASPANGTQLPSGANISAVVNATDADGISNVRLYLNNQFIRQENFVPYEWGSNDNGLKNLKTGNYTLKAIATDEKGATNESEIIISVGNVSPTPVPEPTPTPDPDNGQLIANGIYSIKSAVSDQRLLARVEENHQSRMHEFLNFNDQKWIFEHLGDNVYTVQNLGNKRYLEVGFAKCDNGSPVTTWIAARDTHQKWKISRINNKYFFRPLHCQGKAMDRSGGEIDAKVHLWGYRSTNVNQQWLLETLSGAKTTTVNDYSNVRLFPNPTSNLVTITGIQKGDLITIINTLGQRLSEKIATGDNEQITLHQFDNGMYFISINGQLTIRVLKRDL